MADRYWVGGSGNINDSAHWSTTSGGTGGASIPTSVDNAYWDANSFTTDGQTVTMDSNFNCYNCDWTGITYNVELAGSYTVALRYNVYKDTIFNSKLNVTWDGNLRLTSSTETQNVYTYGVIFKNCHIAYGGTKILQDNFELTGELNVYKGTFSTNGYDVTVNIFQRLNANVCSIKLNDSNIYIEKDFAIYNPTAGLTYNSGTSTIYMQGTGVFIGDGLTNNKVVVQEDTEITENTTITTMNINAGKKLTVDAGKTLTITTLKTIGSSNDYTELKCETVGSTFTLSKASGTLIVENFDIQGSVATGGADFFANNSTDNGYNSGWIFTHNGASVYINGVDKSSYVAVDTVEISDELNARNACTFAMKDTESGSNRPDIGQEVKIWFNYAKVFAGTIDSYAEQKIDKTDILIYQVNCVDYNQLMDRYRVPDVYESQNLGDIVKDIIDNYVSGEGITYTNVEDGPEITKAVFTYVTANQAFNELSDLTGYDWYIDYDKDLHFFSRETNVAPEDFTDFNGNVLSLKVTRTRDQYRNKQYIRAGYDITAERTENFVGDGNLETFVLKFGVAKVPTITVTTTSSTTTKTVGIRGVDTGKDWYWSKGEKEITQDDSGTTLTSNDTLNVTYQGLYPIIALSERADAITDRQTVEGGNGIYEAIEEDSSIESQDAAIDKANALLRRYGDIPEIVEIETLSNGFRAGQLVNIDIADHGLSGSYLIQSVKLKNYVQSELRYMVKCLSGENIGGWIDFFKKIANQGKYVIRENEVLLRVTNINDEITLSDSISYTSAAPETRIDYAKVGYGEIG